MKNKKVEGVMEKWLKFYDAFCSVGEEKIREEYERVCEEFNKLEKEGVSEDRLMYVENEMNRMYVMMESMGMMK